MFQNLFEKFEIILLLFCALTLTGCAPRWWQESLTTSPTHESSNENNEIGGGQDSVTIDLPFESGYQTRCTQGAGGTYSHDLTSTLYDADLDTPNDRADIVFAPANGTAYVHDEDPDSGFGVHVNIDLHDGTYLVIGHLSQVFVNDMQDVVAGMLIGFEGTTGSSSGDHVHIGRHNGFADWDAALGESLEGLALYGEDLAESMEAAFSTSDMVCSVSNGHVYESRLSTPKWHPNGSLVKTPDNATVYLLEQGTRRNILTEEVFWQQNLDFADVVMVSPSELDCYPPGDDIGGAHSLKGVYDGTTAWLLFDNDGRETRWALPALHWQDVLKSWGIEASTYDDLLTEEELGYDVEAYDFGGPAVFRDGTLIRETTNPTVYVVSDGIAMPVIDWDTLLLLGFGPREILWVDDGVVASVQGRVGSCSVNAFCITADEIFACGGSSEEEGVFTDPSDDSTNEDTGDGTDTEGVGGPSGTLSLTWTTPGGVAADWVALSGEIITGGVSLGWQQFSAGANVSTLNYEHEGLASGDTLRFSVEFQNNGTTSWSCLAPFPPGVVQGTTDADYDGLVLTAVPADDPESLGCGMLVTVP